jgi:hypothetical protein
MLHRFTHFHLRIRPLWIPVQFGDMQINDTTTQWCDHDRINELGLPKPVSRLVARFFDEVK